MARVRAGRTTTAMMAVAHIKNNERGIMKSKGIAYVLWLVSIFGWLGFHRFYLMKIGTGIIWIFTGGVGGLGSLIDLFTLGGQVDNYNAKVELKTLRRTSLATTTKVTIKKPAARPVRKAAVKKAK